MGFALFVCTQQGDSIYAILTWPRATYSFNIQEFFCMNISKCRLFLELSFLQFIAH
jgi:hypothetical protein